MKINILGGGPAGLYFAILMRLQGHEIHVIERNPPGNTFGWGVVFSDKTMAYLRDPDPVTHERILTHLRTWENVDIIHRGELTSVAGNRFSGIARLALLQVLQERCRELGVNLSYGQEIQDPARYREADLLVGADGVASRVRARYFRPQRSLGLNRYIWFGTAQPFNGLTLTFRPYGGGMYMAHSYKYSRDLSTFIVEVDQPTWQKIRRLPDPREHLQKVFAPELQGHPLLSNRSKWIRFVSIKNPRWWVKNVVLLGDALHTAHFSIGSGTKLAMEDSIALARAFQEHPTQALPAFEAARRPAVEKIQAMAEASQRWFEEARQLMHLEVVPFVYEAMTRSGIDLSKRDPVFWARYQGGK